MTTNQSLYVEDAVLTFDYHMFGEDIGKLAVEGKNEAGQWQRVWTKTGQQQTGSSAKWLSASIDFSSIEKLTDVRFVGIAVGGMKGEIGLDNIRLDSAKRVNKIHFNLVDQTSENGVIQVNWDYQRESNTNYKRFIVGENQSGEKKWIHTYDSALQYDYDNLTWGQRIDKDIVCEAFGAGDWDISLQVGLNRDRNTATNISNMATWRCN